MARKSKAIAVPDKEIDEKEYDELIEKYFKKLMQETKTKRYKICMKIIAEKYNPDDFGSISDSVKSSIRLLRILFIEICELEKERDEAQSKLRKYQDASKS